MREIKFRAWDIENNKFFYNPLEYELECISRVKGRDDWQYESYIGFSPMEFEIFVIEQFTGLHDKNGKEIYEGDIVKNHADILVIEWNNNFSSFCLMRKGWMFSHFFGEAFNGDECEVIGNIHENPELMK